MSRKSTAWLLIAVWIAALGWQARRELFRPEAERLALGAATLPPGTAYYRLASSGRSAGMASVEIDTLPGRRGFRLTERITTRVPGLGPAGVVDTWARTWLGPGVTFDSLEREVVRGADTVRVRAALHGDTLRWEGPRDSVVQVLPAGTAVQTDVSWPLRYAAAGGSEAGEERRVTVLDPLTGTLRSVRLRTISRGIRTYADSADTDPETGRWVVAGRDTVRAWEVERSLLSGEQVDPSTVWVDEDGRLLEATTDRGLRMLRTAFELAFFEESNR